MANFDNIDFIKINNNSVKISSLFGTLQLFGQIQPFVRDYLQYYTIQQEIQSRDDLIVTTSELGQRVIDFRMANQLNDSQQFEQWLEHQGLDYSSFEQQALVGLKLEKLKQVVAEPNLKAEYEQDPNAWDKVDLIYLTTLDKDIAAQMKSELDAGEHLESVYQKRTRPSGQAQVVYKRDLIRRNQLRPEIRAVLTNAAEQDIHGPILMGNHWCICSIQKVVQSTLDLQIQQELQETLFNRWLAQHLKLLKVEPADGGYPAASLPMRTEQDTSTDGAQNYAESAA